MDELLKRINELAKKQKEDGLTAEEKEEQAQLRQEYLKIFRGNFKNIMMNTKVIDPEGTDITPEKLKQAQAEHHGKGQSK
ncbi:DUF896 domain-containing protein [Aerococcus urinae]